MSKKSIIQMMTEKGHTYIGEDEWYVMFDLYVEDNIISHKDFIKNCNTWVEYEPNTTIKLLMRNQ